MASALRRTVLSTAERRVVIGHRAAVDVVRSTASSTEYRRAGGVIGRCAAVDVVRSTVRSTEYNRAVDLIYRCSS